MTDAKGHYIFTNLGRGTYNMWVDDPMRDFSHGLIYINLLNIPDVDFQASGDTPNYTVSGKLVGSPGLEGIKVTLMFNEEPYLDVHSDSQGFYVFTGIPNGDYEVVPIKPDISFTTEGISFYGADVSVPDISGTYDQNIISGFIFDLAQVSPAFGAPVGLFDPYMNMLTDVTTDNWGFYAFTAVPDGDYFIVFGGPSFLPPVIRISVTGGNINGQTAETMGGELP